MLLGRNKMYCENCGKELKDCICKKEAGSLKNKNLLIIGAAAVAIGILLIVFLATRPEKVYLADYIVKEPNIIGFNGQASMDEDELYDFYSFNKMLNGDQDEELLTGLDFENASDEELEAALGKGFAKIAETDAATQEVLNSIKLSYKINGQAVEELTGLTNGDKIEVLASSNMKASDYYHLKFVSGSREFTVAGLEEGIGIDVFSDGMIQITTKGIDGEGEAIATLKDYDSFPSEIYFLVENNGSLNNGDEILIMAKYDKEKLFNLGYYLEQETIPYTVTGLGSYLKSAEEIPEEFTYDITGASMAKMNDWFNLTFMGAATKVDFEKMYFGVIRDTVSEEERTNLPFHNLICVVGSYYKYNDETKYYCYVRFPELVLLSDGELEVNGANGLSELFIDVIDWGIDEGELLDRFENDTSYTFSEVSMKNL